MNTPHIVEVISRHVALTQSAQRDGWKGCCPFHKETTPSFYVSPAGHYHCFGCRAHGNADDFLREIAKIKG